jgi:hypothetical protein
MTDDKKTAQLKPDFSHRLESPDGGVSINLTDTVGLMAERAKSIIAVVAAQFQTGGERLCNDQTNYSLLYSAVAEIEDICAIVSAFRATDQPLE